MSSFGDFLHFLGDLHDCTVTRLTVDAGGKTVAFEINDLYWNYESLPEYRGPLPGLIVLEGVDDLQIDLTPDESGKCRLAIAEFAAEPLGGGFAVAVRFADGGTIAGTCRRAMYPAISLP